MYGKLTRNFSGTQEKNVRRGKSFVATKEASHEWLVGAGGAEEAVERRDPGIDILKLIRMLRAGKLEPDELLTRTYPIEQINEVYGALERGEVARSVAAF